MILTVISQVLVSDQCEGPIREIKTLMYDICAKHPCYLLNDLQKSDGRNCTRTRYKVVHSIDFYETAELLLSRHFLLVNFRRKTVGT